MKRIHWSEEEGKILVLDIQVRSQDATAGFVSFSLDLISDNGVGGQFSAGGPLLEIASIKESYWDREVSVVKDDHPRSAEINEHIEECMMLMVHSVTWGHPQLRNDLIDEYWRKESRARDEKESIKMSKARAVVITEKNVHDPEELDGELWIPFF